MHSCLVKTPGNHIATGSKTSIIRKTLDIATRYAKFDALQLLCSGANNYARREEVIKSTIISHV